jgi:two-component SAPR family response regulator
LRAVTTDFQSRNDNMEPAIALNLTLQSIEKIAFKFGDLPATKACHVNVISLGSSLIVVLLTLQMHEIELIYKPVTLEQIERAIDRNSIDLRIQSTRLAEDLAGVQMLLSGLDDTQNRTALARHP